MSVLFSLVKLLLVNCKMFFISFTSNFNWYVLVTFLPRLTINVNNEEACQLTLILRGNIIVFTVNELNPDTQFSGTSIDLLSWLGFVSF